MLMDNKNRLQIIAYYFNGNVQSWGYDGQWFNDYDAVLADVANDFPDDFPERYQGVVGMRLDWNNDQTTIAIKPVYGEELIAKLTEWLTELGVYQNGN